MWLICLAGEQDDPRFAGIAARTEGIPVGMTRIANMLEIIHSGAFQTAVAERESAGLDDINFDIQARTSP